MNFSKLLFTMRGIYYFKLRKKGNACAVVVNNFDDSEMYRYMLNYYRELKENGDCVYILCAFNSAALAVELEDYRDIFIFENDADKMMNFCIKHGISRFYYYDNYVLFNFFKSIGIYARSLALQ